MKHYYISGTSRGIGKSLVDLLLHDNNNIVHGISRTQTIYHENYQHHYLDLNDIESVKNFEFDVNLNSESVVLINNSGILGDVNQVGNLNPDKIVETYNVNTISPSLLMNKFIGTYKQSKSEKIILNTSSGAGRHTIKSWSVYCASKSALDMFSNVINEEQKGVEYNPAKVYSVAPGIVDTQMQDEIREISQNNFADVTTFINCKEQNMLSNPDDVAVKFKEIIDNPSRFNEVILDLRNL